MASLGQTQASDFIGSSTFRLTAPGRRYEPLYDFTYAAVAQRQAQVCLPDPCAIQVGTEPPGRRPPAPGSQSSSEHSVTGGPFGSLDGLSVSRQAGFRQSSFILAESKTIGWASVTRLLSLTHCYTCGGQGMPQPLFLPAKQSPLAAYLRARLPRPVCRVLDLCEEQAPLPIFAFHLAILSARGPCCSIPRKGRNLGARAVGREQYRRVLWYAHNP